MRCPWHGEPFDIHLKGNNIYLRNRMNVDWRREEMRAGCLNNRSKERRGRLRSTVSGIGGSSHACNVHCDWFCSSPTHSRCSNTNSVVDNSVVLDNMVNDTEVPAVIHKEFNIEPIRMHLNILEAARRFPRGSKIVVRQLPGHPRSTIFYIMCYASRAYQGTRVLENLSREFKSIARTLLALFIFHTLLPSSLL